MKVEFFRQIFEKSSNIKCYINSLIVNRTVRCGQTDVTKVGGPEDLRSTTMWGQYTTCCKSQSCAPDDGQRIARNVFSYFEDQ
jgi:hypothetical protein